TEPRRTAAPRPRASARQVERDRPDQGHGPASLVRQTGLVPREGRPQSLTRPGQQDRRGEEGCWLAPRIFPVTTALQRKGLKSQGNRPRKKIGPVLFSEALGSKKIISRNLWLNRGKRRWQVAFHHSGVQETCSRVGPAHKLLRSRCAGFLAPVTSQPLDPLV